MELLKLKETKLSIMDMIVAIQVKKLLL